MRNDMYNVGVTHIFLFHFPCITIFTSLYFIICIYVYSIFFFFAFRKEKKNENYIDFPIERAAPFLCIINPSLK